MAERVVFTTSVQVARPPADVFAYLTDVSRHAEWSPKAYRVEGMSPGDHVVTGSQFVSYGWLPNDKDHRNDVEATVVDAPGRLELTSMESGETFISTFNVTASNVEFVGLHGIGEGTPRTDFQTCNFIRTSGTLTNITITECIAENFGSCARAR